MHCEEVGCAAVKKRNTPLGAYDRLLVLRLEGSASASKGGLPFVSRYNKCNGRSRWFGGTAEIGSSYGPCIGLLWGLRSMQHSRPGSCRWSGIRLTPRSSLWSARRPE